MLPDVKVAGAAVGKAASLPVDEAVDNVDEARRPPGKNPAAVRAVGAVGAVATEMIGD